MARHREDNINPPFNTIRHEPPEVLKAKSFDYHTRANTLETHYQCYPTDRPPEPERDRRDEGRGR